MALSSYGVLVHGLISRHDGWVDGNTDGWAGSGGFAGAVGFCH